MKKGKQQQGMNEAKSQPLGWSMEITRPYAIYVKTMLRITW